MRRTIDLNADVGEDIASDGVAHDAALLDIVASASIACGFHAGSPTIMRDVAAAARARGVGIGAHPSFHDRANFGRREMVMAAVDIETMVAYQIGALQGIAATVGVKLGHVKPHGALYNMAARDAACAMAVGRAIRGIDPALIYVGQAGSEMEHAAARLGLACAREAFPDRGYDDDGRLLPRGQTGAVISDPAEVAQRARHMASDGSIVTATGRRLQSGIDTLCIHGDTPHALAIARAVRAALEAAGMTIAPLAAR